MNSPCYGGGGKYLHSWHKIKATARFIYYRCSSCGATVLVVSQKGVSSMFVANNTSRIVASLGGSVTSCDRSMGHVAKLKGGVVLGDSRYGDAR